MKRFKTAVVIGKFYPPHRGHTHLIDTALAQSERVTVIVCDEDGQTISGETRAAWLREIHPDATVLVVRSPLADDDSAGWARSTIEWLGHVPEAAFTSEAYGDAYARHMGSTHVSVDADRRTVPISASAIRGNPLQYLDYLEPCVRAHFVKRVVVIGAESTGTTTLAMALAEHYQTAWVPEFGRLYTEARRHRGRVVAQRRIHLHCRRAGADGRRARANRQQGPDLRYGSVRHDDLARAISGRSVRRGAGRCGGSLLRPLCTDRR